MKKMKLTHSEPIRSVELEAQNKWTSSEEANFNQKTQKRVEAEDQATADFNEVKVLLIQGEGGDIAPYAEILDRVGITGG